MIVLRLWKSYFTNVCDNYEGGDLIKWIHSVTLQLHVADQAPMPHMKAMSVPL